jgi:cytoskeletal protein CcmA (bactofilin family)
MTMADNANPQDFQTTLGPDAVFKGELSFDKGLRLQGRLEGKINTPGRLHVAKEAKMQADVEAGSIVVEGDVHGNLSANERIELKQSARYEGDLRTSKLVVDEGAVFSGHVQVGPEAVKNRPAGQGIGNVGQVGNIGRDRERDRDRESGGARPMAVPQAQPVK